MVTKGLRISPTGAMQQMHHLFRYQKVRGQTYSVSPTLKWGLASPPSSYANARAHHFNYQRLQSSDVARAVCAREVVVETV